VRSWCRRLRPEYGRDCLQTRQHGSRRDDSLPALFVRRVRLIAIENRTGPERPLDASIARNTDKTTGTYSM